MKKIGPYEVLGLLGKGGMAHVYKVLSPENKGIFALKQLAPDPHLVSLLGQEEIKRRFVAEAKVMAKLDHPNIIQCKGYGENEGNPYIIMEYYCHNVGDVIGETYRCENPSRPLRMGKSLRYARETLRGLSCLHAAGIIHRDIKPFNLLLDRHETIKITDFGLSKLRGEVYTGPTQLIVGSPYYAAPEQERDPNQASPRSDLFSLGVLLYRMLTGWLPLDEQERIILPSKRNPELGSNWDAFLLQAMAHNEADRYGTADSMFRELDSLEKDWDENISQYCNEFERSRPDKTRAKRMRLKLRTQGLKIGPGKAMEKFGTDRLWRPRDYVENFFLDREDGTVLDVTTGLIWQQSGSEDAMTWQEAHEYVEILNKEFYAGADTWRLPTIEELLSILSPPNKENYCIEAIFDRTRKWLWSADRSSFVSAWYVSIDSGYVSKQDFTCRFFVRAVSSV